VRFTASCTGTSSTAAYGSGRGAQVNMACLPTAMSDPSPWPVELLCWPYNRHWLRRICRQTQRLGYPQHWWLGKNHWLFRCVPLTHHRCIISIDIHPTKPSHSTVILTGCITAMRGDTSGVAMTYELVWWSCVSAMSECRASSVLLCELCRAAFMRIW
jgi:hypothetical protein